MGKKCCSKVYIQLRTNRAVQIFVFLVMFALNTADLTNDWLLYHDVAAAQEGLAFGPTEESVRISLLFFSIVGAVVFVFEIVNFGRDIFRRNPWLDMDLASTLVIWLEDIPQITISLVILACREEAISIFQLGKASVVILGALIRLFIGIVWACRRRSEEVACIIRNKGKNVDCKKQKHPVVRFFMFLGLTLLVFGSCLIFLFTQTTWKHTGFLKFNEPHSLFEGEFIDEHYFQRVGVYGNIGFLDNRKNMPSEDHWVRLFEIHDLRHEYNSINILLEFSNDRKFLQVTRIIPNYNKTTACFNIEMNGNFTVLSDPSCSGASSMTTKTHKIIFKFQYVSPTSHRILGDITYNVKGTVNKSCEQGSVSTDPSTGNSYIMVGNFTTALRYYQVKEDYQYNNYMITDNSTSSHLLQFYSPQRHLEDITSVWRTGFLGCKYSGSVSPHQDSGLSTDCDA
ncbi:uncharacterized protein LOC125667559 [Ostrea edulis]|uniref:uncharacterized protein LOC125667559 n=1 Tax=Ostrea edulis TaxID=37623 RepID=UPI00209543E7|nr:uncharacterized protein LOC125667559 [Ostrea edulis]XP_048757074.1 uncharacterized protein LOC125667559 [Ostrea edulis]